MDKVASGTYILRIPVIVTPGNKENLFNLLVCAGSETHFRTKLLCRKQSLLLLFFQMFGQVGFGALKKFLEKNMVMVMTFQCSSKCILYRVKAENLSYLVLPVLPSIDSVCMHGLWKSMLQSIGNVCPRQRCREWWNSCVFAIPGS